ncbi:Sodium/calcium exchanger protein [Pleurostoma richardsiae]|uniref:Sodium/calcium exchanger protein n=1 Tax=Pleurostoma richardsiae TaxID=41990 RepID=A0AA38VMW4_9PEZI|nr:Sodium/calcium exchanger protein [Pleurostoma richardsiae]
MSVLKPRRRPFSLRPFYSTVLILTLLTTYSLFLKRSTSGDGDALRLHPRAKEDEECAELHHAADKCAFVKAKCADYEAGLLPYLTFYYCGVGSAQPVAFGILVIWLGLLFTTIGIAASDFFSVNLSTIASILGLSESLAGVTFLAFGNGSPDVFSTFAAMGSNSGSMAVGELIGAASFITAVVAGSMALVREFKVSKRTFVRDICFFIAAVGFTMVFLSDGHLYLWESCVMIGFYVFYVIVVVGWHWYTTSRRNKRAREAASRGHYYAVPSQSADELEPFHDEEEEADVTVGRPSTVESVDITALESGPRVEIDESPLDDEDRGMHVAAEMTSSMRVNRPRGKRSNTTITAIRPSLVGALEFRSVLSSLQKARNMRLTPLSRSSSDYQSRRLEDEPTTGSLPTAAAQPINRERALSSGDTPLNLGFEPLEAPQIAMQSPSDTSAEEFPLIGDRDRTPSPSLSTKGGHLAPPDGRQEPQQHGHSRRSSQASVASGPLKLQIPSPQSRASQTSSPSLSPFPGLTESPMPFSPLPQDQRSFVLPSSVLDDHTSLPGLDHDESPKPVRWWPYRFLPAPHILYGILFPTLQAWKDKNIWDKFVSVISVPSIFLLVTTLPVVETESPDDSSETSIVDPPPPGEPGNVAPPISVEQDASVRPETEWQEYRRSARSRHRASFDTSSSAVITIDPPEESQHLPSNVQHPAPESRQPKPTIGLPSEGTGSDDAAGWNRWLVSLQIFTGPLFTAFIVWANTRETMETPGKDLMELVLYSLIFSLIVLAILLLTTTPEKKPKYHYLLCFLGFVISVAWISTVAGEVVGVLKAFGLILGISEAILGLTIFAVGNSLGDLVADVTVARLGYPVMALSACFGGPLLNILLGIGIGGAWMTVKHADQKHHKHPDRPMDYKPYKLEVGGTLLISAVTVLLTLIVLLIVVPANRWMMTRKIGWGLIAIWSLSTIVNLAVEMTGVWRDVA